MEDPTTGTSFKFGNYGNYGNYELTRSCHNSIFLLPKNNANQEKSIKSMKTYLKKTNFAKKLHHG